MILPLTGMMAYVFSSALRTLAWCVDTTHQVELLAERAGMHPHLPALISNGA